ncbi:hypothetical protein [Burkholderia gladioli]|uniref:hypothetical protein n=1 Tax=Burkholderia gladioli TaxID=28095 RepID=UPI001C5F8C01|nr:hypothetical protein [Burkholderia gladioli]MBW5284217.1 hypothetical protein [Burkholderia gladioli]
MLSVAALSVALGLHQWAEGQRFAAFHGDARVRAARQAFRTVLHWSDAVSVGEHALAGIGMAFVGTAVLQCFYFVWTGPGRAGAADDTALPWPVRVLLGAPLVGGAAALARPGAYGHTGPVVAAAVALAAGAALAWPDRLSRLARDTPARLIALTGGLAWLKLDLAWKWSEWSTTHDSGGVVLLQLLASGVTLLGVSAAVGRLSQRVGARCPARPDVTLPSLNRRR